MKMRDLINACESYSLNSMLAYQGASHTNRFIRMAVELANHNGIRAKLEPMVIGNGVQITWMERRKDARVDIDGFLKQLIGKADESGLILQLAVPGHDPSNEATFGRYGFRTEQGGPDLVMQRQPEKTFISDDIQSVA